MDKILKEFNRRIQKSFREKIKRLRNSFYFPLKKTKYDEILNRITGLKELVDRKIIDEKGKVLKEKELIEFMKKQAEKYIEKEG